MHPNDIYEAAKRGYRVAYHNAIHNGKLMPIRTPQVESAISKHPHYAGLYAKYMIQGRWELGEESIIQCPESSYAYAYDVIQQPFPEGESIIATDSFSSYHYARDVLYGRFIQGEQNSLAIDLYYGYLYATDVINTRWLVLEEKFKNLSSHEEEEPCIKLLWNNYQSHFGLLDEYQLCWEQEGF